MMDDMERRAGFYVSTNGTRSDLSIVVVITFLGKSASLGAIFFALCNKSPRFQNKSKINKKINNKTHRKI